VQKIAKIANIWALTGEVRRAATKTKQNNRKRAVFNTKNKW